jgi:proteic killer suppression protein
LELAFAKKSLRQLCENEASAEREFGARVAAKLASRLADLHAALCVKDLVAGKPYELDGSLHGHMAVNLGDGYRMVFCANHNSNRARESHGLDWSKVMRVKIIEIERHDY